MHILIYIQSFINTLYIMKMKTFLILFFLTMGLSSALWAQENQWLIATKPGDYLENTSQLFTNFPDKYIKDKQRQGEYIKHIAHGADGWRVVTAEDIYTEQVYIKSAEFPEDFIETNWDKGLNITSAIYADNVWVIVMSDQEMHTQTWFTVYDKEALKNEIQKYWKTHSIHLVTGMGDGGWFVVMSSGIRHVQQRYKFGETFPAAWVKENQAKGQNITVAAYANHEWMVVMSTTPEKTKDTYVLGSNWNKTYLDKAYQSGNRVSLLVYSSSETNSDEEVESYFTAAMESFTEEQYHEAIELLNYVIGLAPNHKEAYIYLAFSKLALERYKGALADAQKAVQLDKNNSDALYVRGLSYLFLGDYKTALIDYNKLVQSEPNEAIYIADRGYLQEHLGNTAAAIADYKKALTLDENNEDAINGLERLRDRQQNIVIKQPTITWDAPTALNSTSNKASFALKACLTAENQTINKVRILHNGKELNYTYKTRGLTVEDDCTLNINHNVTLQNGANTFQIEVITTAHTISSQIRTVNYKEPQNQNQQQNPNPNVNLPGNYHALLIGISEYTDLSIKDLERPVQDVQVLKNVLISQYTFKPNDVHTLLNPTKDEILNKVAELQEKLTSKDNLIIFYAGHGIVKNNVGYWMPSDATNASRDKWFSNAELKEYINGFKAQHVLVVADACFSGALITGGYRDMNLFACEQMEKVPSRRAMTSGANTVVPDNSIFFDYFIKRLKENTASCFTAEDLYSKIKPAVINNSPNRQIPQFGALPQSGDEGGNFIFKKK